ncbi:hypothetical protein HanXRQr2_Chr06g0242891 [Helianthus annuus]|uniref:Uncharacterized protein n=1 Tax=Helianthus annuus TaxID=4232 RepID=A0A9K3IQR0_HELAN|nr:hypothetical protein HanXRQr2_Chr06g0242891 [Helianthus annuus]
MLSHFSFLRVSFAIYTKIRYVFNICRCRGYFARETTHLRLCTDYTIACLHKQRNGLPLKNLQLMGNRMLMTGSCTHKRLKFCSVHYKQHHDRLMTNCY